MFLSARPTTGAAAFRCMRPERRCLTSAFPWRQQIGRGRAPRPFCSRSVVRTLATVAKHCRRPEQGDPMKAAFLAAVAVVSVSPAMAQATRPAIQPAARSRRRRCSLWSAWRYRASWPPQAHSVSSARRRRDHRHGDCRQDVDGTGTYPVGHEPQTTAALSDAAQLAAVAAAINAFVALKAAQPASKSVLDLNGITSKLSAANGASVVTTAR